MKERTFSIIKAHAVASNMTGKVNAMIEAAGLRIVGQKRVKITKEQAQAFYAVHKERPFFDSITTLLSSGPIVVQVLEGDNAIKKYREIMGSTNPEQAAEGTIRKTYGVDIEQNVVHGSDSPDNAKFEAGLFFSEFEIVG